MTRIFLMAFLMTSLGGTIAMAHPHGDEKAEPVKKVWPYFGEKSEIKKSEKVTESEAGRSIETRLKEHADNMTEDVKRAAEKNRFGLSKLDSGDFLSNPDDLRQAAAALERMLADSDILENMAEMVIDLAEDIEIENDDNGLTLRFDGKTLGSINIDRDGHMN